MISTQTIFLKDALKKMEERDEKGLLIPFSIRLYKANRKTKQAGKLLYLENCVLSKLARYTPLKYRYRALALKGSSKRQNHLENSTRNVLLLNSQELVKIHIRLLTHFNGMAIIW